MANTEPIYRVKIVPNIEPKYVLNINGNGLHNSKKPC